jgi:hypothetical protein
MVEKAADGVIIEGIKVGKQREAEWIAKQLLEVKDSNEEEVGKCCARLYCMETFLYKKLNETMRLYGDPQHETLVNSKIPTFGPFAWFLCGLPQTGTRSNMTVFRGAQLPNGLIEQYRNCSSNERVLFPAYTSTSRNRSKAEFVAGNVLFVIDIYETDLTWNLSPYSVFDEEEQLLHSNYQFRIESCAFEQCTNKWIIHLRSCMFDDILS